MNRNHQLNAVSANRLIGFKWNLQPPLYPSCECMLAIIYWLVGVRWLGRGESRAGGRRAGNWRYESDSLGRLLSKPSAVSAATPASIGRKPAASAGGRTRCGPSLRWLGDFFRSWRVFRPAGSGRFGSMSSSVKYSSYNCLNTWDSYDRIPR